MPTFHFRHWPIASLVLNAAALLRPSILHLRALVRPARLHRLLRLPTTTPTKNTPMAAQCPQLVAVPPMSLAKNSLVALVLKKTGALRVQPLVRRPSDLHDRPDPVLRPQHRQQVLLLHPHLNQRQRLKHKPNQRLKHRPKHNLKLSQHRLPRLRLRAGQCPHSSTSRASGATRSFPPSPNDLAPDSLAAIGSRSPTVSPCSGFPTNRTQHAVKNSAPRSSPCCRRISA
jgi:hypothetical protein